jgi:hypothetical protein
MPASSSQVGTAVATTGSIGKSAQGAHAVNDFMYGINSVAIACVLFVSMLIAIEAGYRLGRRGSASIDAAFKEHIGAIQGTILGILALLLGFTFSLSLQRFDERSASVVDEANAIGTADLRARLLPLPLRAEVQALLREYLDARVRASTLPLIDVSERDAWLGEASRLQSALWDHGVRATQADPNPATSGLFVQSLNELIDAFGRRNAALERHVPEAVLILLYGTFLMTGAIVGFSCGIAGHRPSLASYVMVLLIVVLVFIILDLDRPRRGMIKVSQQSLIELRASM